MPILGVADEDSWSCGRFEFERLRPVAAGRGWREVEVEDALCLEAGGNNIASSQRRSHDNTILFS